MSTSLGFGSENLVFVPAGNRLRIFDVYNWSLLSVDVLRTTVRLRPVARETLEMQIEESLQKLSKRKQTAKMEDYRFAADEFIMSISDNMMEPGAMPRVIQIPVPNITFWVRITDVPAESFFAEDYEEAEDYNGSSSVLPVYGSFHLQSIGGLEVPFPGTGQEAAFEVMLPADDGLHIGDIDARIPLPLVEEYCGATGVSAKGNTINLNLQADIATAHLGSVPLRKLGTAFVTLYFSQGMDKAHQVVQRLAGDAVASLVSTLEISGFETVHSGNGCRIFMRAGDCFHLYEGLEGRESAGVVRLPPFLIAATAAGETSPAAREVLLRSMTEAVG